ncbi:hypothetical protein MLD38_033600 [Melastoma candidum]|uniref:Uncharacterized protein n=1 Tax=Melastoma candidum TaxID=119954 RepID=A0ACB9M8M1_9MYRT|nr:hypothetical protein MLD38_033600 [Melastoma candidum]
MRNLLIIVELSFQAGVLSNPHLFVDAVRCSKNRASSDSGWTRVIVEQPFGQDLESSRKLTSILKKTRSSDCCFFGFFMTFEFLFKAVIIIKQLLVMRRVIMLFFIWIFISARSAILGQCNVQWDGRTIHHMFPAPRLLQAAGFLVLSCLGFRGAGKTTMMDVLAGRKTGGCTEGTISISRYLKNQVTFARISGYCEQNDIHSPHVTVYESVLYSAWLRPSSYVSEETRTMFVEEVMELVELNPIRNALVGLPRVNGLSTEQRKRLTIAVELVANPSIIFMDEPTSGLDARAVAIVMRTVRNTVDTGRTVVCTIHQSNIDIFEAFDEIWTTSCASNSPRICSSP